MKTYSFSDDATPEDRDEFVRVARLDRPFAVDEKTYVGFRDRESEGGVQYDYEVVMADGGHRTCDFVHIVGDDEAFPYLGFWTDGKRFFCQHLMDRLIPTADGADNFLPPPPATNIPPDA